MKRSDYTFLYDLASAQAAPDAPEKKYDIERHITRVLDVVHLTAPLEKKLEIGRLMMP